MAIDLFSLTSTTTPMYNGLYPDRPVWGYIATTVGSTTGTAPSSTNNFWVTFGQRNPTRPMTFDFWGNSSNGNTGQGRAATHPNETGIDSGNYYAGTNNNSSTGSSSRQPSQGHVGCTYVCQTGTMVAFDGNDTGWFAHQRQTNYFQQFKHSGIVIGEETWNQTFHLHAVAGKILKTELQANDNMVVTPAANPDFFYVSSNIFSSSTYGSPTGVTAGIGNATLDTSTDTSANSSRIRNNGMICHNRNSGKLAYLETLSTTGTWRMHIIDLQNKIGQTTTTRNILTWINEAVAAGSSRYDYYDITLPSWSQAPTVQQCQMMKVILCDDDTVWIVGWDKDDSSNAGTLRLYRSTNPDTYTFSLVTTLPNNTTSYGIAQGNQYGIRHMNSDDNTRVAVYTPYNHYHAGLNCFIVDTRTAVADGSDVKYMRVQNTSSASTPIVPIGGKGWMHCNTHTNNDTTGAAMMFFTTPKLYGNTLALNNNRYFPTILQSTAYASWVPFKIQPTREFKDNTVSI